MKEKQVTMSLDLAKQMLGKDEAMDMLIKQNFSDEELGIKPKLPKRWEDLRELNGFYIDDCSDIYAVDGPTIHEYKNTLPTKKLAEAMLALCQLLYLRDIYNDGWQSNWQPNWKSADCIKSVIISDDDKLASSTAYSISHPMIFKTPELRDEFLLNFRDLLEIAKPLL